MPCSTLSMAMVVITGIDADIADKRAVGQADDDAGRKADQRTRAG